MPRKPEYTVRVVQFIDQNIGSALVENDNIPSVWVEALRYMGHAKELAHITEPSEGPERVVIEFYAPRGLDTQVWANHNAERMRTFGINAAAAPKWESGIGASLELAAHTVKGY
jgi:hypothetical protein